MINLRKISALLMTLTLFVGCAGMHYHSGVRFLKEQKYDRAIDSFKKALDKRPEDPKALTMLGVSYYKREMYGKALSNLKMAKTLRVNDKRTMLYMSMAYLRDKQIQEAITEWNTYLDMYPSDKVSDSLKRNIAILKKGDAFPETVDLMTSNIETLIDLEKMILEKEYYKNFDRDYGPRYIFFHGRSHRRFK
tara:strand:- start:362 stop:937 length:576 start_codon:yes stop_codon:yes gene_type:complete